MLRYPLIWMDTHLRFNTVWLVAHRWLAFKRGLISYFYFLSILISFIFVILVIISQLQDPRIFILLFYHLKGDLHLLKYSNFELFVLIWLDELHERIELSHIEDSHEVVAKASHLTLTNQHLVIGPNLGILLLDFSLVSFSFPLVGCLGKESLPNRFLKHQHNISGFMVSLRELTTRKEQHRYLVYLTQNIRKEELISMLGLDKDLRTWALPIHHHSIVILMTTSSLLQIQFIPHGIVILLDLFANVMQLFRKEF